MHDFEKLGAFYLGRKFEPVADELTDELVLYDSKDLTTHAVIVGMTGSGKTGLGISLIEEAAIDRIPVIAVDPKGDLGNLLLTFPELRADRFRPWVNAREASDQGLTVEEFAKAQARLWREGLKRWGQDAGRIARLRDSVDLAIYTPGSSAGLPVSVLGSFAAPAPAVVADADAFRERVQATATGLLSMLGVDADPITSREHILIANLLDDAWRAQRDLDLGALIAAIQKPPFARIGVMDIESFYPANDRFALAMRLNSLLAAPGFEAWMSGPPLDAGRLLYTPEGKPRVSILSIAHLDDRERMFFVSMLLNELTSWMRAQPGTTSLRALLYMDEIFGYMPPVANPPSKRLFLTLLKQARAYGVGLVLATQNPVDLDYKGLSNTGTWFIGRLQTERDKARLLDGLEGAASGQLDRRAVDRILAGLGKRRFLLHNVHETGPVVFNTRWALSYLPGPLTREQIHDLMADRLTGETTARAAPVARAAASAELAADVATSAPTLSPSLPHCYVAVYRAATDDQRLVYHPAAIGVADVAWRSARYKVDTSRRVAYRVALQDGPAPVDWLDAEPITVDLDGLESAPRPDAGFAECPAAATRATQVKRWAAAFKRWLREHDKLTLHRSPTFKLTSRPRETEAEFRVRLQQLANERRDERVAKLRKKYGAKSATLRERLRKAEQRLEVEGEQARQRKYEAAISIGSALLGAFLGRKKVSRTSASRVGTAARGVGRVRKETGDVRRAEETVVTVSEQLAELDRALQAEVDSFDTAFDAQHEPLEPIVIRPKTTDLHVHFAGLAWLPYYRAVDGSLTPAWR